MSEEMKGDNVAPESTDHVDAQESQTAVNDGGNTVQYETYRRVLGKLKSTESKFQELQNQLTQLKDEKFEAEGNKDKLIESLKEQVRERDNKLKTTVGTVARSQAMNAIVDEAVKAGCNSPDVVKKFLEDKIETLNFDQDFNVDRDEVKALIEEARAQAPILFSKEAPKVANHNVSGGGTANPKPNLKKMSMDDLVKIWGTKLDS